jgi:hypothetical protein
MIPLPTAKLQKTKSALKSALSKRGSRRCVVPPEPSQFLALLQLCSLHKPHSQTVHLPQVKPWKTIIMGPITVLATVSASHLFFVLNRRGCHVFPTNCSYVLPEILSDFEYIGNDSLLHTASPSTATTPSSTTNLNEEFLTPSKMTLPSRKRSHTQVGGGLVAIEGNKSRRTSPSPYITDPPTPASSGYVYFLLCRFCLYDILSGVVNGWKCQCIRLFDT